MKNMYAGLKNDWRWQKKINPYKGILPEYFGKEIVFPNKNQQNVTIK
jgi:hypothetical protein